MARRAPKRPLRPRKPTRVKRRTQRRKTRAQSHHRPELLGLGLLATGLFLASLLYLGWDGGAAGEKIVDGLVNGVGYTIEGVSAVLRLFQTGFVGTYALFFTLGVVALLVHFLRH